MSEIKYKALLVGNSLFEEDPHELPELKGPPNDIRGLEDALKHPQIGLHEPEDVTSILNADNFEILKAMEKFFMGAGRDDQLLFYYSGHGRLDLYNNLYLCARNTNTGSLISTSISDVAVGGMIQNSKSNKVIVILDCCNSGIFKGGMDIPKNLMGEGRFVITSSRAKELSVDALEKTGYSAFTKHLIQALLSNEVDINKDRFISLNEVYDYVLPRLQEETRQNPKRNFDGAVGELAISKANEKSPELSRPDDDEPKISPHPPILAVSSTVIEIRDVQPDEKLPEEIIDVYNQGGGELRWSVECKDEWIEIEKAKTYFKIRLNAKPGTNRGRIYVRDEKGGGTRRIQVMVQMNKELEEPRLELSQKSVDFGTLNLNSSLPKKIIRMINTGGGELNAKVTSLSTSFNIEVIDDLIEIIPVVSEVGNLVGEVMVNSKGGDCRIPVIAKVEKGAVLHTSHSRIDFGSSLAGEEVSRKLIISNDGSSKLHWEYEQQGDFFETERRGDQLTLSLISKPGSYHGSLIIKSNGGDKTIDVKGSVKVRQDKPPDPPSSVDITGTWTIPGIGYLAIYRQGTNHTYQEYNMMGVVCGEGMVTLGGNRVVLNGSNIISGPVYAEFTVAGNIMNGYITAMGQTMAATLNRQAGANTGNFNWMNLFS